MSDFNILNRCIIIQYLEEGFIKMEQFLIYIVRQNIFIPGILLRSLKKF